MYFKPKSLKSFLFVFVQFLCIVVIVLFSDVLKLKLLNIIFIALFLLLGIWAIFVMKNNFNIAPDINENSNLITKGPYKYIRHPMYLSVLGSMLFLIINNFNYITIIFGLILLLDLILKLSFEEKIFSNRFPEYSDYKKHTKKLIPYIF